MPDIGFSEIEIKVNKWTENMRADVLRPSPLYTVKRKKKRKENVKSMKECSIYPVDK